jgi:pilus assembly protein CpaC
MCVLRKNKELTGKRRAAARRACLGVGAIIVLFALSAAPAPVAATEANGVAGTVEVALGSRTTAIKVPAGKSEHVHTDTGFADVIVADPDIADVAPLTDRSLSVFGKKIGTTRVSVYSEEKRLVGVFDIEVSYDTGTLASELAHRFPHAHLKVSSVNGRIMLSGQAPDGPTVDQAVQIAKQFGQEVINSVQVAQAQQVLLEVRFVEVNRTAQRELGIGWRVASKAVTAAIGTTSLLSGNVPFGTVIGHLLQGGTSADAIIQALEERDMARRLAEPNLVALSGDTASFLAGGEIPIPISTSLGQVSVEWKRFGVGLAFTPTVLSDGLINLKIEPEVSQLDPTQVVQFGGIVIPTIIVRRANTTLELRDGQSFAMAGLLQDIGATSQQQLPWLGEVPVLGALFRSAEYQKKETDLVIIVTPHLVQPMRPGEVARVPTDNTLPGNDADLFLGGQPELPLPMQRQLANVDRAPGGHILELGRGASYAEGH